MDRNGCQTMATMWQRGGDQMVAEDPCAPAAEYLGTGPTWRAALPWGYREVMPCAPRGPPSPTWVHRRALPPSLACRSFFEDVDEADLANEGRWEASFWASWQSATDECVSTFTSCVSCVNSMGSDADAAGMSTLGQEGGDGPGHGTKHADRHTVVSWLVVARVGEASHPGPVSLPDVATRRMVSTASEAVRYPRPTRGASRLSNVIAPGFNDGGNSGGEGEDFQLLIETVNSTGWTALNKRFEMTDAHAVLAQETLGHPGCHPIGIGLGSQAWLEIHLVRG